MKVTSRSRLNIRLQNILFVVLLLALAGMAAWLSTRYNYQADWTAGARNTLSPASRTLLKQLQGPISITAYARETPALRHAISELVNKYRRYKPDVTLTFVNPDGAPERVRQLGISVDGELLIAYQGRSEKLQEHSEQGLTNALQRVARADKRWVVFLSGHGERSPHGEANHDLGTWVRQLEQKGLTVQTVNLAGGAQIPDNTSMLVIASPQVNLLPGELTLIQTYLNNGGNLLWLHDPGALHGLEPVAEQLGVEFQRGVIVDPSTQMFGIERPEFALVAEYPLHPITRNLNTLTLFPAASGIDLQAPEGWEGAEFLTTQPRSWAETGEPKGEIAFDKGSDIQGPLTLGVGLTRARPAKSDTVNTEPGPDEQRVAVIGDGDFLSNTYLGNGGNLNLGINIINWLSRDDNLIAINATTAPDTQLNLSRNAALLIGFGFLFALPLALFAAGWMIWLKRRRR